jgi:hypothetical protein
MTGPATFSREYQFKDCVMADKKKQTRLSRSLWGLVSLVPNVYHLACDLLHKIKMEAYLTVKHILILCFLTMFLACLITATWISLLGILFFTLLQWQWTWYIAALVVMGCNLLLFIILFILLRQTKDKLTKT